MCFPKYFRGKLVSRGEMSERDVNRRGFLTLAGSTAATAALAGCTGTDDDEATPSTDTSASEEMGEETPEDEQQSLPDEFPVTITQGQLPETLDPHDHRNIPADIVARQAYEGVLSRTREGEIIGMLATGWERVDDRTVRFSIREGPTFQQTGNELTPEDVAYSINRMVQEDVGIASPQSGQLTGVAGAEAVSDERAVRVNLSGLNPTAFAKFAIYCDVIEKQWAQDHEASYIAQNVNGTGPFQLADYEQNVRIVFERYEDYWRRPAPVTELTFNAAQQAGVRVNQLVAGETDVVVNLPPQSIDRVNENDGTSVGAVGSTRIIYNAMRYDVEPFSSPQFRRAMNLAVDLESIVENVLQGFGEQTSQPTLQPFFGYDSGLDPYEHDPDEAERLVEESGHAGAEITLHTPVGRYLRDVQIAQAVVSMIDELPNVSASLRQREFGNLAGELTDGNIETSPHFYLIGWGNATFDASQTINPTLTSDGVLTSYKNDELDQFVADANSTADRQERDELLQQANAHCHEQAPWIYLNRQYSVYGISDRIQWQPRNDERIDAYSIQPAE